MLGERGRRGERLADGAAVRDERDVLAGAPHSRAIDRHRAGAGRELALHAVERRVLEEDHRVGVLERRAEHAARVLERRRGEHLEARDVRVVVLQAVRVLRGDLPSCARRHADDERHADLPPDMWRSVAALLRI